MNGSTPHKPVSTRFQKQRERILDAATPLLNDRGVTGMRLEEVAQALGLTTTSILYYFRRKEQLAAAVFEDSMDRLETIAEEALAEPSPKTRVRRYVELHFDYHAATLRGEVRPLAILSEIRALEDPIRGALIEQYQQVFRKVRAFFGATDDGHRRTLLTGRAHMLNEALFWLHLWLPRHSISDFPNVRRRFLAILEKGIAAPGTSWPTPETRTDEPVDEPSGASAFLSAATRLINEFGYRGASIDRIAAELNLTKGSFYHYLDAKDDLVLECYRASHRRILHFQERIEARGEGAWQQLASGIAKALEYQFSGDFPILRSTALQAMPTGLKTQALELFNRTALRISGLIVESMEAGQARLCDPLIASHIVMSTINSAYDIRGWARRQPLDQAIATYGRILMNGIFD